MEASWKKSELLPDLILFLSFFPSWMSSRIMCRSSRRNRTNIRISDPDRAGIDGPSQSDGRSGWPQQQQLQVISKRKKKEKSKSNRDTPRARLMKPSASVVSLSKRFPIQKVFHSLFYTDY